MQFIQILAMRRKELEELTRKPDTSHIKIDESVVHKVPLFPAGRTTQFAQMVSSHCILLPSSIKPCGARFGSALPHAHTPRLFF